MLFGRRERLEKLDVAKLEPAPNSIPERLETGTQNHEGIVGAAAAVKYLASLARESEAARPAPLRMRLQAVFESIHGRESVLSEHLWNELESVKGVRLFGPPPSAPRTPTIAFTIAVEIPPMSVASWPIEASSLRMAIFMRRLSPSG